MHDDIRNRYKDEAAARAVAMVQSHSVIGLGTGTTAWFAIQRLAARLHEGSLTNITGAPTSNGVRALAESLRIPLESADMPRPIDLTIDGADEVAPGRLLIKGGGGALLREKIVAQASQRVIIIVDEAKLSERLGMKCPLPVEVLPFGWRSQLRFLESLGATVTVRNTANGTPFTTDSGNMILDCNFGAIADPQELAVQLGARGGIVGHGLFLGLATDIVIAGSDGVRQE
jgi:ribose 5-phosphate isomerase A